MKKTLTLAALMAAVAAPALAQTAGVVAPAPMMAPLTTEGFRQMAMASDAFEIESSRLALERSRNPAIRRYAQEMIRDHALTSQALNGGRPVYATGPATTAAGATTGAVGGAVVGGLVGGPVGAVVGAGIGATTTGAIGGPGAAMLDSRKAAMLNQLAAAQGREFDRLYVQMQAMSHREAVAMFTAYAQTGTDPAMRTFAQQALPHLEHHLVMAERMAGMRRTAVR